MDEPRIKQRTKILYLITKSNMGGAQRYVYDLATSLSKFDYDVTVAFGEGGPLEDTLKAANIRTIRISSLQRDISFFKDIKIFFELVRIFRKYRPDIIHLNSSKIGGLGGLAGRIAFVPKIIFTGHGWAFNEKRNIVSKKIIGFLHWLTILFSHITIAVSEKTAEQIKKLPGIKHKIVVIHNGISSIKFEEQDVARHLLATNHSFLKSHHKDIDRGFWIGTTSELHKNKGLDIAIAAFAHIAYKYSETCLVIMGEGEERKNLENLIKKLKLENQVFLLGFIPDAKKYLKALDLFTLTSQTEAFPYSILDAGLAKLPVIASNVGGIPEVITHEHSGILVSPGDQDALTRAFQYFILHPDKTQHFGENLYNKVRSDFTVDLMIEKTQKLYEKN